MSYSHKMKINYGESENRGNQPLSARSDSSIGLRVRSPRIGQVRAFIIFIREKRHFELQRSFVPTSSCLTTLIKIRRLRSSTKFLDSLPTGPVLSIVVDGVDVSLRAHLPASKLNETLRSKSSCTDEFTDDEKNNSFLRCRKHCIHITKFYVR